MKRPTFTIIEKSGSRYDANHISIGWHSNGYWAIKFLCSGEISHLAVTQIREITFSHEGANYCSECDRPLLERG